MRIFNATNSVLTLPLTGNQKLEIQPRSISTEFMGSIGFLTMLVTSFKDDQIAIVVSGPYELNVCANVPTAVNYVVQTLDDALRRFCIKNQYYRKLDEEKQKQEACQCDECKKEETVEEKPAEPEKVEKPEVVEEPIEEEKPAEPEPEITEEPVVEETPAESEGEVTEEVEKKPKTRRKRASKE